MDRHGMTIPFDGPLAAQQHRIEELEALGYTDLWSAEANGTDGLTPLALASVWAPTCRLGTVHEGTIRMTTPLCALYLQR